MEQIKMKIKIFTSKKFQEKFLAHSPQKCQMKGKNSFGILVVSLKLNKTGILSKQ